MEVNFCNSNLFKITQIAKGETRRESREWEEKKFWKWHAEQRKFHLEFVKESWAFDVTRLCPQHLVSGRRECREFRCKRCIWRDGSFGKFATFSLTITSAHWQHEQQTQLSSTRLLSTSANNRISFDGNFIAQHSGIVESCLGELHSARAAIKFRKR